MSFISLALILILYDINVENFYVRQRLLVVGPRILNLVDDVETLCCTAKDRVLPVEPGLSEGVLAGFEDRGGRSNRKVVSWFSLPSSPS